MLLIVAGCASVVLVFLARGATWKAVWIGVASTTIAAGLVDAGAQIETAHRERALFAMVAQRVRRISQDVALLVRVAFDIEGDQGTTLQKLRDLKDPVMDLRKPEPGVFGHPSKLELIPGYLDRIDEAAATALALGSLTRAIVRVRELDEAIGRSALLIFMRVAQQAPVSHGDAIAQAAIDLVGSCAEAERWFLAASEPAWPRVRDRLRVPVTVVLACLLVITIVGFATEHRGQTLWWVTLVTVVSFVLLVVRAAAIPPLSSTAPMSSADDHPVDEDPKQPQSANGAVAATLVAVIFGLAFNLLERAVDADAVGRAEYVLLLIAVAGVPAALVAVIARYPWRNRAMVTIAAGLSALDVFWPFAPLRSLPAVSGATTIAVLITIVVVQAVPGAPPPPDYTGTWDFAAYTVSHNEGWVAPSFPAEAWNIYDRHCRHTLCDYQVIASNGERFALRGAAGDTLVAARPHPANCVHEEHNQIVVSLGDGYRAIETLRLRTKARRSHNQAAEAFVSGSESATATQAALMKACQATIRLELRTIANRRTE